MVHSSLEVDCNCLEESHRYLGEDCSWACSGIERMEGREDIDWVEQEQPRVAGCTSDLVQVLVGAR